MADIHTASRRALNRALRSTAPTSRKKVITGFKPLRPYRFGKYKGEPRWGELHGKVDLWALGTGKRYALGSNGKVYDTRDQPYPRPLNHKNAGAHDLGQILRNLHNVGG